MSDDLAALANQLQTTVLERLATEGWTGTVTAWPAPEHSDTITLRVDTGHRPPPTGHPHAEVLVPAEVLRDAPIVDEYLAMLIDAMRWRRRVNCYVGTVVEHHTPGHPNHGFEYRPRTGAWGRPEYAAAAAGHIVFHEGPPVVRVVDVDTHEEWYVRP